MVKITEHPRLDYVGLITGSGLLLLYELWRQTCFSSTPAHYSPSHAVARLWSILKEDGDTSSWPLAV